ncbi:MAG: hypothetical protein WBJ83_08860 [Thermacetogeniaceae bacterium]|jgi:hypothetical protein|nr:hypothetical protein [Syntrophomonadaceae bacterium]
MFFVRLIILTAIFFLILNYSQLRSGNFKFQPGSLILPFSLSFALVIVDTFLRAAFFYALLIFIVVALLCYFLLRSWKRG